MEIGENDNLEGKRMILVEEIGEQLQCLNIFEELTKQKGSVLFLIKGNIPPPKFAQEVSIAAMHVRKETGLFGRAPELVFVTADGQGNDEVRTPYVFQIKYNRKKRLTLDNIRRLSNVTHPFSKAVSKVETNSEEEFGLLYSVWTVLSNLPNISPSR